MKLKSFKQFLLEGKKKSDDDVEVNVTKTQAAYYKDMPKSTAQKKQMSEIWHKSIMYTR